MNYALRFGKELNLEIPTKSPLSGNTLAIVSNHFYITTPIYYVNDKPHLGTAYTMVIADAFARWHRIIGDEVFFLTGTDEHGQKIATAAAEKSLSPQAWVDEASRWFADAWSVLNISNDAFIRTTEARHHESVRRFMQAVYDSGYIYKANYEGWYCVACEAYYLEDELGEGRVCPQHKKPAEWMVEENYFFALSKFEEKLLKLYADNPDSIAPLSRYNEIVSQLRQGLMDISITRTSIDWGVKVPWDEKHVFYVWCDALVNYLTAIGYATEEDKVSVWWPNVHHVVGKDIIKFHCIWWPALCMAAGLEPPGHILAHGWLLVSGEKMSKSRLNQIEAASYAERVGVEALRYHFLREITLGADADFSEEGLTARYNSDLANNLGNLLSRVSTLVASKYSGTIPAESICDQGCAMKQSVVTMAKEAVVAWNNFSPDQALLITWNLIREANAFLETNEPWKMQPGDKLSHILSDALEVLQIVAVLAYPAIPDTAQEIWRRIGMDTGVETSLSDVKAINAVFGNGGEAIYQPEAYGLAGNTIIAGEPLFPRRK
jgi:methionyl-tRNA synthetase